MSITGGTQIDARVMRITSRNPIILSYQFGCITFALLAEGIGVALASAVWCLLLESNSMKDSRGSRQLDPRSDCRRRGGDDRLERPLLAADMTFFCLYRIFRTDVLANDPHIR